MNDEKRVEHAEVVLMCGVSGSGKTCFSMKLAEKGFVRLSVDELIWEHYGERFATLPDEERTRIFMECGKEMENQLLECLSAGRRVVVDSTMCKRIKRDRMRKICEEFGKTPVVVYFKAPLSLLRCRLYNRRGLGPNDQIVERTLLETYFANFEAPEADENPVVINQE